MKARRTLLGVASVAVLVGIMFVSVKGMWLFAAAHDTAGSIWAKVAEERTTLGVIRLAIVAAAIYVVVSVPALIAGRRWLNRIGPTGVAVDDANSEQTISELREDLRRMTAERDWALGLYDVTEEDVS
jgi:hypothetical protein